MAKASSDLTAERVRSRVASVPTSELGEFLQVGKGQGVKRLPCPAAERGDVGRIGSFGIGRATVQPQTNQLVVRRGFRRVRLNLKNLGNGGFVAPSVQKPSKAG